MKKKLIITIVIAFIVFSYSASYIICLNSDAFLMSKDVILNNDLIVSKLGKPNSFYLVPFGHSLGFSGPKGYAEFKININGDKSVGILYIKLEKLVGIWKVIEANLVLENGEIVSVIK